ncbi:MAG: hypothetical protein H5T63_01380 [Chloroflexi bacterium]|nr:hypothetical protein [Chloroflexota bacterium]
MLPIETQLQRLQQWSEVAEDNVLTIYADVNPAKPENANQAWLKRVKNALRDLTDVLDRQGKRDQPLHDRVLFLLEAERPEARTLALFATRDRHGRLHAERLDLQIDLPVVDLAHGRVEARYGAPYITPLWFAVDEYERAGILLLEGSRWRFFEVFLGEIREDEEALASIASEEWEALEEASRKVALVWDTRAAKPGGCYDKLSPKERAAARIEIWTHKLYDKLSHLLDQAVDRLAIERLVLVGEHWQTSHFETYLSRRLQHRIVARMPLWPEHEGISTMALWRRVEPVLLEVERKQELALLDKIREQPGLWGIDAVLDALQLGRVQRWVVPWSLDLTIWRCPQDSFVAATREAAAIVCEQPEPTPLREHVLDLASEYGAELEFVRGEAEQRLLKEMGGMAALLRW